MPTTRHKPTPFQSRVKAICAKFHVPADSVRNNRDGSIEFRRTFFYQATRSEFTYRDDVLAALRAHGITSQQVTWHTSTHSNPSPRHSYWSLVIRPVAPEPGSGAPPLPTPLEAV